MPVLARIGHPPSTPARPRADPRRVAPPDRRHTVPVGAHTRRHRLGHLLVAAATLAVPACSADGEDAGDDTPASGDDPVVATVGDREIREDLIARLLADPAYRAYAHLHDEPPPRGELASSDAGRTALGIVIQEFAIEDELERRDLEPTEEQVAEARALLEPPDEADLAPGTTVKAVHEPFSEEISELVAAGLARYRLLDDALRGVDPDDPELQAELLERAPHVADRVCGPSVVVPARAEGRLREQIAAGTPLEAMADVGVEVAGGTLPADRCFVLGELPTRFVDLAEELEPGQIGLVGDRTPDGDVVAAIRLERRDRATGAEADEAARTVLDALAASGFAAYQRLLYTDLDPELDPAWGRWDAQLGLVPPDTPLPFESIDPPPVTTSTAPPATAPTTTAPPAAPPPPAPQPPGATGPGDPGPGDPAARTRAALAAGVPRQWRDAVPLQVGIISGATSLSYADGRLQMGSAHVAGPWDRLVAIVAHEFGHHIAFRYGTQSTLGAAPTGWPTSGNPPVERWADCVSRSFTGYPLGSHGMSACEDPSLGWTRDFVGAGPSAHPRTG